jgi:predicted phage tail protein
MVRLVDDQLFGKDPDGRVVDPDLIDGGLRSKQFATVIDLLGYGHIEGLRKPSNTNPDNTDSLDFRRDVFLDGTPIINANGTSNFSN